MMPPFLNRAIGALPPGSSIKPVVAAAALEIRLSQIAIDSYVMVEK